MWQFDTPPTQGWGKVGARSWARSGQKARSGQGRGKLATIPMYLTLITPPSLSKASITNQSLYHYLLIYFARTLPQPCPNLAQILPRSCPDLAQTLPQPCFLSRPCPTLPQHCPDLAQDLAPTLPQPCVGEASSYPECECG